MKSEREFSQEELIDEYNSTVPMWRYILLENKIEELKDLIFELQETLPKKQSRKQKDLMKNIEELLYQ